MKLAYLFQKLLFSRNVKTKFYHQAWQAFLATLSARMLVFYSLVVKKKVLFLLFCYIRWSFRALST